jgi:hypothetical protein
MLTRLGMGARKQLAFALSDSDLDLVPAGYPHVPKEMT